MMAAQNMRMLTINYVKRTFSAKKASKHKELQEDTIDSIW